jgi:hypothetical protein
MLFPIGREDDVARPDLDDVTIASLDHAATLGDIEGLAPLVGVPRGAGPGGEMH